MTTTLEGIRVLDLTERFGDLAGRMLADLGAEVIKIEPPGGCVARHQPPFDADGNSLYFAAYCAGKTCMTLDLSNVDDNHAFMDLLATADVLIESFTPGHTHTLGIDYEKLRKTNPGLIYASITPFGQQGPKARWPASELTLEAAGGRLSIQGDTDRPPLPVGFPQAGMHGGAQAAADILIALNERDLSGLGQYLDLSMQEAMWWTLMSAQGAPVCTGDNPRGVGDDRGPRREGLASRVVHARDGLVTIAPGSSPAGTRTMFSFALDEARSMGQLDPALEDIDWDNWVTLYREEKISRDTLNLATDLLLAYLERRTKLELIDWTMENNLRLGPLNTTRDLLGFPHYRSRNFFHDIGGLSQPANWVHLSRTPLTLSAAKDGSPTAGPVARSGSRLRRQRSGLAFEGLRVADFSWVAAGPTITKALADHGATVVKIESGTRPDLSRTLAPHIENQPGLNRSYWTCLYATSKLSLQCNLGIAEGRQLARQVCDWADVVVESFSPGTMARMGLGYDTLAARKPELIMLSTSMLGQSGPLRQYAGYGQQATGFCGLHFITGWPDRPPCGVASPYTDVVAPKFGVAGLAAAIHERRRSGKGQLIDLSQAECAMMFMAPLILDEAANGVTAQAMGMDSIYACPHGVYACAGTERYIAIATETTGQWHKLRDLLAQPDLQDPKYDDVAARHAIRGRLHDVLADFCADEDPWELERRLVATGIPASVVQRPLDVFSDPQIEARDLKQVLTHDECGDIVHYGFCTRFSARSEMIRTAAPCLGQHNDYVLKTLLGLSENEIEQLEAAGAIA